jgi:uncharacterized membrane protein
MTATSPLDEHFALPTIRRVAPDRPFAWLAAGWNDLRRDPLPSLAYGCLFAIAGDLILLLSLPHPHLFMLAVSGFFLVAPLLAAGLYEISRRHQRGEEVSFARSQSFWGRNGQALALFGVLLSIVGLAWERLSAVLFALFVGPEAESLGALLTMIVEDGAYRGFAVSWLLVGAALAALVFVLSALSVPMMLDRPVDMATAAMTSVRGVLQNLPAMLLWAALIVLITLAGFATFLFGLIVLMPILGHASWHAYRDIIA